MIDLGVQRLALGTAQWRTSYGITNRSTILEISEIAKIIEFADALGIHSLDTSPLYGDVQEILKGLIPSHWIVTTKTQIKGRTVEEINKEIDNSLSTIQDVSSIGVLVHDWDTLSEQEKANSERIFQYWLRNFSISCAGFSTYDPRDLETYADMVNSERVYQTPTNIIDQRFQSGFIDKNSNLRNTWVRSIFLQGILLDCEPKNESIRHPALDRFNYFAQELKLTRLQCSMNFAKFNTYGSKVIVGITQKSELEAIVDCWNQEKAPIDFSSLASTDQKLIDPRCWNV